MKKTVLFSLIACVIACLIGAGLLIGGAVFAVRTHEYYTVDFSKYRDCSEDYTWMPEPGGVMHYPRFIGGDAGNWQYYREVDGAVSDYVSQMKWKYDKNVDLDYTVDCTDTTLTIKFTGTGRLENGNIDQLSRTYIFDIGCVSENKLPKLINRAEFIGY